MLAVASSAGVTSASCNCWFFSLDIEIGDAAARIHVEARCAQTLVSKVKTLTFREENYVASRHFSENQQTNRH